MTQQNTLTVNYAIAKRQISANKWAVPQMAVNASGLGPPSSTVLTITGGNILIKRRLLADVIKLAETVKN